MVTRELLAAVLGVGFGLVLIAFPEAVVRSYTAGRGLPDSRRGEYGSDGEFPSTWLWVVRAIGAVVAVVGLAFGSTVL